MSREHWHEVVPFFSVLLLIGTLFSLVLLKMEVRRMGYSILKANQEYRRLQDQHRLMSMEYVRLTRPERVRKYAVSRLTLAEARDGQIIQLTGRELALPQ